MLEQLRNGTTEEKKQYAEILTGYTKACERFDTENGNIQDHSGYKKAELDKEVIFIRDTININLRITKIFTKSGSDFHISNNRSLFSDISDDLKKSTVQRETAVLISSESVYEHLPNIIFHALEKTKSEEYTLYASVNEKDFKSVINLEISIDIERKARYTKIHSDRETAYKDLVKLRTSAEPMLRTQYAEFMAGFILKHGLHTEHNYTSYLNGVERAFSSEDISKEADELRYIIAKFIKVQIAGKDSHFSAGIFTNRRIKSELSLEDIQQAIEFSLNQNNLPLEKQSALCYIFHEEKDETMKSGTKLVFDGTNTQKKEVASITTKEEVARLNTKFRNERYIKIVVSAVLLTAFEKLARTAINAAFNTSFNASIVQIIPAALVLSALYYMPNSYNSKAAQDRSA